MRKGRQRQKHTSTKKYLIKIEKLYEQKKKLSDRIKAIQRSNKVAKKLSRR